MEEVKVELPQATLSQKFQICDTQRDNKKGVAHLQPCQDEDEALDQFETESDSNSIMLI